ncbi:Cu(I)-responsive transcriptional regulator [Hoeflea alexandrii]|uniref:Cu(I)-responsive transcriptional regulator n=1 Tax=Hoeflea alexandrii TaxID=288436 RepID=UPI0022AE54C3|nr:Cu(I)-responsive transcriptional regulator [Hoeflea alexandrii]MCZ4288249.1 Cu(I)-responsive transcriptional regulator [Hoeflea alexandrii]
MNIGEASGATGLPVKTIRYYEDIGLIKPDRAANGYRDYGGKDVHRLAFIQRSRSLGFTIDECRSLLSLYEDKERASSDVKALALDKIREIDRKLGELKSLRATLKTLAEHCHGDDRPDCPIIDEIAGAGRV